MSRSENGSISASNNDNEHQRLCHIVKRDDFDGYGFNLHSEKAKPGQYIGKVDENSPSEQAGLRQGDRIIEVNGVNIGNETHKQVVQRIKAIANEVRLLVIDPAEENKTSNNVQSSTVQPDPIQKLNKEALAKGDKDINLNISGTSSPATSEKNDNHSTNSNNVQNNNTNMIDKIEISKSTDEPDIPQQMLAHQNGTATNDPATVNNNPGGSNQKPSGLNLPMTAAEMRAKLLAKKKYDPKNDTVDLRKKFDIIQKL